MKTKCRFTIGIVISLALGVLTYHDATSATLSACQNKKTGTLRVAAYCKKKEIALNLNTDNAGTVAGPAGPRGPAGPQGARGIRGPRGLPGGVEVLDANGVHLGYLTQPYETDLPDIWVDELAVRAVLEIRTQNSGEGVGDVSSIGTPYYTDPLCDTEPYYFNLVGGSILARDSFSDVVKYKIYVPESPKSVLLQSRAGQYECVATGFTDKKMVARAKSKIDVSNRLQFLDGQGIALPIQYRSSQ